MPPTIDSIMEQQGELLGRICRSLENLKKIGVANITQQAIETRLEYLCSNWEQFRKNDELLLLNRTPELRKHQYFTEEVYIKGEEAFLHAKGEMKTKLGALSTPSADLSASQISAVSHHSTRSLPKLSIPKFSGEYHTWPAFRDLFKSIVDENQELSSVEKFHYLKSYVTGEAERHISNFAITSDNYTQAWQALHERYENKRVLVRSYLDRMFALAPVTRKSATDLKTLIATVRETLGSLKALDVKNLWDTFLVHFVTQRLDAEALEAWELHQGSSTKIATFAEFDSFLNGRIRALEALDHRSPVSKISKMPASSSAPRSSYQKSAKSFVASAAEKSCALCSAGHYVSACPTFNGKTPAQRREFIISKNLCFNCLGPHHFRACQSTKKCKQCNQSHHTSLHNANYRPAAHTTSSASASQVSRDSKTESTVENSSNYQGETSAKGTSSVSSHIAQSNSVRTAQVLLATALVNVLSQGGVRQQARALLDQGSEISFISESFAQRLKFPRRAASIPVVGIGAQSSTVSHGSISVKIISRTNESFSIDIDALVLPKLTTYLPSTVVVDCSWPHLKGLELADPTFMKPGRIDLILGASAYSQIIDSGICKGAINTPIAQHTALGWILSGPTGEISAGNLNQVGGFQCSVDQELLDLMQKFWHQEEINVSSSTLLSPEEQQCEEHFMKTHSRDSTGRFIVRLPCKSQISNYGDSRTPAQRMLERMENRFNKNQNLYESYAKFMQDYLELNHMRPSRSLSRAREFFLPHHGVVRQTSSTTKLRVVFNGSQKTNFGTSLNDNLHIGPKLQSDITTILLRWRQYAYVFASDIIKMYRQIRVHEDDWPSQQILWRTSPNEEPRAYELCTVTYGLASAPYLALRCIQQLAIESPPELSFAAEVLRREIYVDDILSGDHDVQAAKEKIRQLKQLLMAGGFELQKWMSNSEEILSNIPTSQREVSITLSLEKDACFRTLGVLWNQQTDSFLFVSPSVDLSREHVTKRTVLSTIAQMYDPLGWLAPIICTAKIIMQELWAIRLDWDTELPDHLRQKWTIFLHSLNGVNKFTIPRWFGTGPTIIGLELHGFSDASQDAMAAVIYLRVLTNLTEVRISLVCAKTKVAPLKRMTIPRLELSAALLLVKQVTNVCESLSLDHAPIHLWTDSTVALTWIKGHPSRWKDFVRNRVAKIQELSNSRWHHVAGKQNPADLASRGVTPHQLQEDSLWWNGPPWLQNSSTWQDVIPTLNDNMDLEERSQSCNVAVQLSDMEQKSLISRYSSLQTLLRITSWCFRAFERFKGNKADNSKEHPLSPPELQQSLSRWVKLIQQNYFSQEIKSIRSKSPLAAKSSLRRIMPFLDDDGLLRIKGRLRFSQLEPDQKSPIILPRDSLLTTLVIRHHHLLTLHGGTQLTLSSIRQKFWIIGGRAPVKSYIHRCIPCTRYRASLSQQQIGQLPESRVTPSRPFLNAGVDYAGPINLKTFRGRGAKTYKGYFIIFVCLSTSAIHLEVATDYSTDGFLAAYRRFAGRRGLCSTITSDCGTNLIGADRELKSLFAASSQQWQHISNILANDGVTWRFIPPSAPHFGGKWEAGVKSVKHHLRRVIGETLLTYEELSTLLTQIEAVLNSRPLCAISDDPSDLSCLTPGHFLIGSALTTVPEPSLQDIPQGRLSRWQLLQQLKESFWQRWSTEYLHQLQTSSKWLKEQPSIKIGDLVLVKDERYPPSRWPLGRVIEVHPGKDNLVRVATVKTQTSVFKRPIVKLCLLPSAESESMLLSQ